jgi:choloylglycine hydrolase
MADDGGSIWQSRSKPLVSILTSGLIKRAIPLLAIAVQGFACTGIELEAKDGSIVHGRTLEFGTKILFSAAVVPRGYSFSGTTPLGKGLEYESKYGAVGAILFNEPAIADGMNEKGLSVGTFYFPGFAKYADITPDNQSQALSPTEFPNWIITQFENVEEVKETLPNVLIAPTVLKAWGNMAPPFHYIVYDRSGGCIVIEPIDGQLIATDNPFGVMTNSPTFDWHMTNLRNYINLRMNNVSPLTVDGVTLSPFGQGSGMVGLPGDFTPPSRFIRAAIFSYTLIPPKNAFDGILQVFHVLNQFDIPLGIAREASGGVIHADYTMVTCARDPQSLKYYFKTYEDQTIRMVDLNAFDLDDEKIKTVTPTSQQPIVDISSKLK